MDKRKTVSKSQAGKNKDLKRIVKLEDRRVRLGRRASMERRGTLGRTVNLGIRVRQV